MAENTSGNKANMATLAQHIADDLNIPRRMAMRVLNSVLSGIEHFVAGGGGVSLKGFGSFEAGVRKGRVYRHPFTREGIETPDKPIVRFKPSKRLIETLRGRGAEHSPQDASLPDPGVVSHVGDDMTRLATSSSTPSEPQRHHQT